MKLKALIVIAALGAIALAFVPLDFKSGHISKDLVDFAHFPLLLLITFAVFVSIERLPVGHRWHLAIAAGTAIAIAFAIELIQPMFARSASRLDIRLGLLGVFAACAAIEIWRGPPRTWLRMVYVLAMLAALALALRPIYHTWRAGVRERRLGPHFPLFADFEHDHEISRWRIHGTKERRGTIKVVADKASRGSRSLRVNTPGHSWNSLGHSVRHRGWTTGKEFAFDLHVTDNLSKVQLQLQDGSERRFRKWLAVKPGWNTLRIPLTDIRADDGNRLDLRKMRYLSLSVPKGDDPHVYYIDNVRVIVDTAR